MIRYKVQTGFGEGSNVATFYHSFDIEDDNLKLTNWNALTSLDIDKFILMDDGNELYVKISYVNGEYVRTSGGTYRVRDIIHCAIPKHELNGYSGASAKNEHFNVRKPTKKEVARTNKIIKGDKITGRITERIQLLLLEKLQEATKDKGFDEVILVNELMDGFLMRDKIGKKDPQWLNAGKLLCKINGFDIEQPNGIDPGKQIEQHGFQRFNGGMTTVNDVKKAKIEVANVVIDNNGLTVTAKTKPDIVKVTVKDINKAIKITGMNKKVNVPISNNNGRVMSSVEDGKEIVNGW